MPMTPAERLDEIEREPWDVDRLDMEALLDACGFTETEYGRVSVWYHGSWNKQVTLFTDQRTIATTVVETICSMIRYCLASGGTP